MTKPPVLSPANSQSKLELRSRDTQSYPVLALRNTVAFPGPTLPLTVRRAESVRAVEAAMKAERLVFVVTEEKGVPLGDTLDSTIGVVARIEQVQRGIGGLQVLVTGLRRARATAYDAESSTRYAQLQSLRSIEPEDPERIEFVALNEELRNQATTLAKQRGLEESDVTKILESVRDAGQFADLTAAHLDIDFEQKRELLETLHVEARMKKVLVHLQRQVELQLSRQQIRERVAEELGDRQREMYLREQLKAIREELGDGDAPDQVEELKRTLAAAELPVEARSEVEREFKRLDRAGSQSAESQVSLTYLERMARIPWAKRSEENLDPRRAEKILDADHYGLNDVKDRVIEHLSVRKLRACATTSLPQAKSPILLLTGPPGVGKTSIARSVARSLGRESVRIALGGAKDESDIRGHRRTYVGAMPGRIVQALERAQTKNPVIILDEIDKLGASRQGDPASALLEVLDPAQNNAFVDHYLNVPVDLSEVLFIATANQTDTIPAPLLDRMEAIAFSGYTATEKLEIAKRYLLPNRLSEAGLGEVSPAVEIQDSALERIIEGYTHESGVRQLNLKIQALLRRLARFSAVGRALPPVIGRHQIEPLLGRPKLHPERIASTPQVGLATGLYYTPMGGDILFVEAALRPLQANDAYGDPNIELAASTHWGPISLKLTGQLGDVMKESAQAALTYATSHADSLQLLTCSAGPVEAHIHVPAGAIPKDGPSAGVTIATALISAMSHRAVRPDVVMTGELTLTGRVLPVGGIKEKVLGAHRAGATTVVLPSRNAADLEDVPEQVRDSLEFCFAETLEDVLEVALEPCESISVSFPPFGAFGTMASDGPAVIEPTREESAAFAPHPRSQSGGTFATGRSSPRDLDASRVGLG